MNTSALKISNITLFYWTDKESKALERATSAKEMLPIALTVISRMPQGKIHQVCGPIGSGGHIDLLGEEDGIIANLNSFNNTIKYLQTEGLNVFDQMPFEGPMQKLKKPGVYPREILEDFYWPLFESGLLYKLVFMKNYETSKGALEEWNKVHELNSRPFKSFELKTKVLEVEF